jgi:hypothetical protein
MLRDGRRHRRERNRERGVQQMAGQDDEDFRRVGGAAVAPPERDGDQSGRARYPAARQEDDRLGDEPDDRGHPMLQLEFERPALTIAGDLANRHERQQENRRDFVRAERRAPDADERGAHGTATRPRAFADFAVRADRIRERKTDERPDEHEHGPPGARRHQLAELLLEQPDERRPR